MKSLILIVFFFLILTSLVCAETTFFDNPDDVFILSNSITGGIVGELSGGTSISGKSCIYEWNCTEWSKCLSSGKQNRNCINIGTCSNTYQIPETEQNCIYTFEGEIFWREIINKNQSFIFPILFLSIIFILFYIILKKYSKKIMRIFKRKFN